MATGDLTPSFSDDTCVAQIVEAKAKLIGTDPPFRIPRPLNSPRLLPLKRPFDLDAEGQLFAGVSLPFQKKRIVVQCVDLDKLSLQISGIDASCEVPIELPASPPEPELPCILDVTLATADYDKVPEKCPTKAIGFHKAVDAGLRVFREAFVDYVSSRDAAGGTRPGSYKKAIIRAEERVTEKYEEMRDALLDLLPWAGSRTTHASAVGEGTYEVIQYHGCKLPRRLSEAHLAHLGEVCVLEKQLAHVVAESRSTRVWDAIVSAAAALASRKEKNWLEPHEITREVEDTLDDLPGCKNRSARRKTECRKLVEAMSLKTPSHFGIALVQPSSVFRMSFADRGGRLVPASIMVTYTMSLRDCLKDMDDSGPLRGEAAEVEWARQAGRQFSFQSILKAEDEGTRTERQPSASLKPDPRLRDLLRSKEPVLYLDAIASLAPREVAKQNGLSDIVRSELATLLRDAKARGQAVVFLLGSMSPHQLAEKVYLRPPLTEWGLRAGYLRWRASAEVPWARERAYSHRVCLCLQMP